VPEGVFLTREIAQKMADVGEERLMRLIRGSFRTGESVVGIDEET
jgi:hypothetical protein